MISEIHRNMITQEERAQDTRHLVNKIATVENKLDYVLDSIKEQKQILNKIDNIFKLQTTLMDRVQALKDSGDTLNTKVDDVITGINYATEQITQRQYNQNQNQNINKQFKALREQLMTLPVTKILDKAQQPEEKQKLKQPQSS